MKSYRVICRRQLTICAAMALAAVMLIVIAGRGASAVATASDRLLPIYSVGRAEDDKTISISFDAACPAG